MHETRKKKYIQKNKKKQTISFFMNLFLLIFYAFFGMFLSNTILYLLRADDWSIAVTLSFYKFSYKPKFSKNRKNKNIMLIMINIFFLRKYMNRYFILPKKYIKGLNTKRAYVILLFTCTLRCTTHNLKQHRRIF